MSRSQRSTLHSVRERRRAEITTTREESAGFTTTSLQNLGLSVQNGGDRRG
jgi:hypothetical protein